MAKTDKTKIYKEVIEFFGSATEASEAIGVSKQTVSGWYGYGVSKPRLSHMSVDTAITVDMVTNGLFKAKELNDDINTVFEFIKNQYSPDDVFDNKTLKQWALRSGYSK